MMVEVQGGTSLSTRVEGVGGSYSQSRESFGETQQVAGGRMSPFLTLLS